MGELSAETIVHARDRSARGTPGHQCPVCYDGGRTHLQARPGGVVVVHCERCGLPASTSGDVLWDMAPRYPFRSLRQAISWSAYVLNRMEACPSTWVVIEQDEGRGGPPSDKAERMAAAVKVLAFIPDGDMEAVIRWAVHGTQDVTGERKERSTIEQRREDARFARVVRQTGESLRAAGLIPSDAYRREHRRRWGSANGAGNVREDKGGDDVAEAKVEPLRNKLRGLEEIADFMAIRRSTLSEWLKKEGDERPPVYCVGQRGYWADREELFEWSKGQRGQRG